MSRLSAPAFWIGDCVSLIHISNHHIGHLDRDANHENTVAVACRKVTKCIQKLENCIYMNYPLHKPLKKYPKEIAKKKLAKP